MDECRRGREVQEVYRVYEGYKRIYEEGGGTRGTRRWIMRCTLIIEEVEGVWKSKKPQ